MNDTAETWYWEFSDEELIFPQWHSELGTGTPNINWLTTRRYGGSDPSYISWGLINRNGSSEYCFTCEADRMPWHYIEATYFFWDKARGPWTLRSYKFKPKLPLYTVLLLKSLRTWKTLMFSVTKSVAPLYGIVSFLNIKIIFSKVCHISV